MRFLFLFLLILGTPLFSHAQTQLFAEIFSSTATEGASWCVNLEGESWTTFGDGHRGTYPAIDTTDPTGNNSTVFDCNNPLGSIDETQFKLWQYFTYPPADDPGSWVIGDYWIDWDQSRPGELYSIFNWNGSVWTTETKSPATYTLVQSEKPEFIEIIKPTLGTTTSTTTVQTNVRFQTPPNIGNRPATARVYVISDAVTQEVEYTYIQVIPALTTENIIIDETIELTEGSKIMDAYYSDENAYVFSEVDTIFFNVVTNSYFEATGLDYPGQSPGELTQNDCTTFDVGCQFQKALIFAFYPSSNALDRFSNIWQTLSYLAPFGYITVTLEQLDDLDTDGTPTFSFGILPFQEAIFTPLRDGLGAIMWAVFGIYFFIHRLRHIDI